MLEQSFEKFPEFEAIVDGDVRLTYRQLNDLAERYSSGLRVNGVRKGDRIVIWAPNGWQWIVAALACWQAGAVLVPISTRLKALEVLPVLQKSGCRIAFSGKNANGRDLPGLLSRFVADHGRESDGYPAGLERVVLFSGDGADDARAIAWDEFSASGGTDHRTAIDAGDTCEIIFTSGTTGRPKGVMLGHGQVLGSFWNLANLRGRRAGDRHLVISPFSHVTGLHAGLLTGLMTGGTLVLSEVSQAERILNLIETESITVMAGPPGLFERLVAEDADGVRVLSNLRIAILMGAPASEKLVRRLKESIGIPGVFIGYAMTECCSITSTERNDDTDTVATTVGKAVRGVALRIVDDDGVDAGAGETGEIQVRGYCTMQGYFGDEEQTRTALTEDGWLRTGDLGCMTSDGHLRIVGRKKDMFISYGFNVFPSDVESLLMTSGVLSSVAVVSRANRFSGEEGVAFVVPKPGAGFERKKLLQWARQNIANYKVPSDIRVLERLPLDRNGKIDRNALVELFTK